MVWAILITKFIVSLKFKFKRASCIFICREGDKVRIQETQVQLTALVQVSNDGWMDGSQGEAEQWREMAGFWVDLGERAPMSCRWIGRGRYVCLLLGGLQFYTE